MVRLQVVNRFDLKRINRRYCENNRNRGAVSNEVGVIQKKVTLKQNFDNKEWTTIEQ